MTWQPIYHDLIDWPEPDNPQAGGFTKSGWDAYRRDHPSLCRDCGTEAHLNQGGNHGAGMFDLCDGCAAIDQCRAHGDPPRHSSHWGMNHTPERHAELLAGREQRRQTYKRAHPAEIQEELFA